MGKIVKQGVEYGGSSNSADCIKYNNTKSVKEAIDEIKASSSSDPTASSVTFNNTDTGLNATNIQDAVTEVNGKLNEYPSKLSQDYTTDNESHTFPIGALSLFFITYGTNNQADVYLCRCATANAHALAPLHTSSVIAQTYEIKLDIATRSVTITSKRPWVRVDIINL